MKLIALSALCMSTAVACAGTTSIPSGSTQAQIQSVISSATAGNSVAFSAGTYSLTSTISIPCGVSIVSASASDLKFGPTKTVRINWTGTGDAFSYPGGCSTTGVLFGGLEIAASPASLPGGGALFLNSGGGAGPTIAYNYLHGVQSDGTVNYSESYAEIFVAGGGSTSGIPTWNNLSIIWNIFGTQGGGDCAKYMSTFSYSGTNYNNAGGFCAAVLIDTSTTNLTITNNRIGPLEEGVKFIENPCGCQSPGGTGSNQFTQANANVLYNDFTGIHRIAIEAQATPNPTMNVNYNDWHDATNPGYGSWLFSLPQYEQAGYSGTGINTNANYNLFVSNVPAATLNGVSGSYIPGLEFWGTGTANGNIFQGSSNICGVQYGYGNTPWTVSNNQYQGSGQVVCSEENQTTNPNPAQSGNTAATTVAAITSIAPTASVGTSSVTLTNPGTGINTNTSIWYTTDGSTPAPGAGTAQLYSGPIPLTATTTVKAVGMWGAANQPTSYASGYGFVPSAVVSATFTGATPAAPTLVSAYMSSTPTANLNTLTAGTGSIQLQDNGTYSDGSTGVIPNAQITWGTTNAAVLAVSSSGVVTGVGAGSANVTAAIGSVQSSQWTVTVAAAPAPPAPTVINIPAGTYTIVVPAGGAVLTLQP